ncbi:MAG: class I SAM-dependent methyltransferase [Pseudomonadota bacterium]
MPDAGGSRLARMIARLSIQRAHLEEAAKLVADVPGPVLEIGLGKARTYDHLCHLMPDREIFAFDGAVHCPPAAVPPEEFLIVGDFQDTLAEHRARFEGRAALAHCDFGTEDQSHDMAQAAWLADLVAPLMRRDGVVLADRELALGAGWKPIEVEVERGPFDYFGWKKFV